LLDNSVGWAKNYGLQEIWSSNVQAFLPTVLVLRVLAK
jgi:hypothetical protein